MIKRPQSIQQFNHLKVFHKKINKQLKLQEQIRNGYEKQIKGLEQRKLYLSKIIDKSFTVGNKQQINQNDSLNNFGIIDQDKSIIGKNISTLIKNQSGISHAKQKKQQSRIKLQSNYLKNANSYKYNDLVEEIQTLSKIYKYKKIKNANKKNSNNNQIQANEIRDKLKRNKFLEQKKKEQFMQKKLQAFQVIQTISPSDQVTSNLIKNLQKQERKLVQTIYQYKNLLIKQNIKTRIQQKTDTILKDLYKKQKQQKRNVQQNTNRNKDIVKFGYTKQMLEIIKNNRKERNQQGFQY